MSLRRCRGLWVHRSPLARNDLENKTEQVFVSFRLTNIVSLFPETNKRKFCLSLTHIIHSFFPNLVANLEQLLFCLPILALPNFGSKHLETNADIR
jgi:hypothetical protein